MYLVCLGNYPVTTDATNRFFIVITVKGEKLLIAKAD